MFLNSAARVFSLFVPLRDFRFLGFGIGDERLGIPFAHRPDQAPLIGQVALHIHREAVDGRN